MTRLVNFTGTGLETASLAVGRPGPFLTSSSVSKALTCRNLEISASKRSMIVGVSMNPPSFILNDNERWPVGFMMTSSVAPFFAGMGMLLLSHLRCRSQVLEFFLGRFLARKAEFATPVAVRSPLLHSGRLCDKRCMFRFLIRACIHCRCCASLTAGVDNFTKALQRPIGKDEAIVFRCLPRAESGNYSFGNILEIAQQRSDATRVAGMY
jgi:hypothetical protein